MKTNNEFEEGMIAGIRTLHMFCNMNYDDRTILFGDVRPIDIINNPDSIISYWKRIQQKDEILASHVEVGDMLRRDGVDYVVTYKYPDSDSFDAIILKGPLRGNVIKNTSFDIFGGYKLDEKLDTINLKKETW